MANGKIKLIAILASLILAGGLFSAVGRVIATPQQEQQQRTEDRGQKTEDGSPSSVLRHPSSDINGREFFYKMLLSVLLVVALGVGAIYVSRKLLPRLTNLPAKQIRVLETAHLAPRKGIHLIQAGTRRLLIASTNETITMLADVTDSATDFAAELAARS